MDEQLSLLCQRFIVWQRRWQWAAVVVLRRWPWAALLIFLELPRIFERWSSLVYVDYEGCGFLQLQLDLIWLNSKCIFWFLQYVVLLTYCNLSFVIHYGVSFVYSCFVWICGGSDFITSWPCIPGYVFCTWSECWNKLNWTPVRFDAMQADGERSKIGNA